VQALSVVAGSVKKLFGLYFEKRIGIAAAIPISCSVFVLSHLLNLSI